MFNKGRGRLFRRKDNRFLIYLPKGMAEDSMFPFKEDSNYVHVSFKINGGKEIFVKEWIATQ
jgi:hypothetical protein